MAPYVKKNLRGNWRSEDMEAALRAVSGGKKINTASKEFRIPRRTLKRYIANRQSMKARLGRRTILTPSQEIDLKSRIKRLANVGYPVTPKFLRMSVYRFCEHNKIKIPKATVGKGMIGRDWLKGYMERHPDISLRKSQKLNPARAQKLNEFVVKDYFQKLQETMTNLDVMDKPAQIYNIDEKGCQLMLHKSPQVLAQKGVKRVHIRASEHAQNVTVVSCGNAMGNAIPPMILFKGKRMKPEWQDNLPPGALVAMTPKGSMNTETFIKWIEHFAKFKTSGPCLLIFDGASSHLDYDIVDVAEKHGITLFCLPSNTTHELQPMDKTVFRAFEHYWDEELLRFWYQNKDKTLTKQRFGGIFTPVWDKALTPSNIKSGFEATGIYPFNPHRIPPCAYAPSIPTFLPPIHEQLEQEIESNAAIINADSDLDDQDFNSEDDIPLALIRPNVTAMSLLLPCPAIQQTAMAEVTDYVDVQPSTSSCSDQPRPSTSAENREAIVDPDYLESQLPSTSSGLVEPRPSTSAGPANNIGELSFSDMMKTPEKVSTNTTPRRKAINSLAQQLKKTMFPRKDLALPSAKSTAHTRNRNKTTKKKSTKESESWYCFICNEDRVASMRLCTSCNSYIHEECVGLTESDKDIYVCPFCEE